MSHTSALSCAWWASNSVSGRPQPNASPSRASTGTINSDLVNVQKIPDSDMEDGY
jgi:hypothetical protein